MNDVKSTEYKEEIPAKIKGFEKPTMWYKFTFLSNDTGSVNLGQGFADWAPPQFYLDYVKKYLGDPNSNFQYTRNQGAPKLVESIARNYSDSFKRKLDAYEEIVVGSGAVNVLHITLTALVNKGDEVVIFEPFYDCYLPQVQFNGGKVVGIPMIPPKIISRNEYSNLNSKEEIEDSWEIDYEAFSKALNGNTRVVLLNTPNNPTGKIFTFEELGKIAKILENFPRIVVIMDEVYEFQIGRYSVLPRMATLPGMWEKTITILSAGKIFSSTGIRVGWAIGPNNLIRYITPLVQANVFCISEPVQNAIADSLDEGNKPYEGYESYYKFVAAHFTKHRNYFLENISKIESFDVNFFNPEGGFFAIADISKHKPVTKHFLTEDHESDSETYNKDFKFLLNLAHEKKVVGIPCSPFYTEEHKHLGENFIRFAYCKKTTTMDKAFENLRNENRSGNNAKF